MQTLFLLLAVILGFAVIVISWRPDKFSVARSGFVGAPPEAVFPHIADLHKWDAWSPWAKLDPNATNEFDGPEQGPGASMRWAGNRNVGVGKMTITEAVPGERIRIRLQFEKPFEADNQVDFVLKSENGGTNVSWSMSGKNGFIGKAMDMFYGCDRMIGGQYEKGLANLKAVVEAETARTLPE